MTAPFEERDGWEMTAIPLDGSVYIELHDPPEAREKRYVRVCPNLMMVGAKRIQAERAELLGLADIYGICFRIILDIPSGGRRSAGRIARGMVRRCQSKGPGELGMTSLYDVLKSVAVVQVSHCTRIRSNLESCAEPERFGSIVRSAVGEIPLCLGGEVDCVNGELRSGGSELFIWTDRDVVGQSSLVHLIRDYQAAWS